MGLELELESGGRNAISPSIHSFSHSVLSDSPSVSQSYGVEGEKSVFLLRV